MWTVPSRIFCSMDIALMPEFRGKGLGGQLMAALLGMKLKRHTKLYESTWNATTPALHLYERLKLGYWKIKAFTT